MLRAASGVFAVDRIAWMSCVSGLRTGIAVTPSPGASGFTGTSIAPSRLWPAVVGCRRSPMTPCAPFGVIASALLCAVPSVVSFALVMVAVAGTRPSVMAWMLCLSVDVGSRSLAGLTCSGGARSSPRSRPFVGRRLRDWRRGSLLLLCPRLRPLPLSSMLESCWRTSLLTFDDGGLLVGRCCLAPTAPLSTRLLLPPLPLKEGGPSLLDSKARTNPPTRPSSMACDFVFRVSGKLVCREGQSLRLTVRRRLMPGRATGASSSTCRSFSR
mmetsp:Transcript_42212/g.100612  ORF Transcript_42212/g.100612 Transcript_42212/m.100612 type:complete len:270 (+) Transcript_42212:12594-13403(+)